MKVDLRVSERVTLLCYHKMPWNVLAMIKHMDFRSGGVTTEYKAYQKKLLRLSKKPFAWKKFEDATISMRCYSAKLYACMRIRAAKLATPTTEIVRTCIARGDLVRSPCSCTLYLAATSAMATR